MLAGALACTGAALPTTALAADAPVTVVRASATDTYWSIAQRYGVDVAAVEAANPTIPAWQIWAGRSIRVPRKAAVATGQSNVSASQGDLMAIARLIAAEERGQPFDALVGVGAVVLNRVHAAGFPKTIAGVIFAPGANQSVSNGWYWQVQPKPQEMAAARAALSGDDPTGGALYFWNPEATNPWIWSRPITTEIGSTYFAR